MVLYQQQWRQQACSTASATVAVAKQVPHQSAGASLLLVGEVRFPIGPFAVVNAAVVRCTHLGMRDHAPAIERCSSNCAPALAWATPCFTASAAHAASTCCHTASLALSAAVDATVVVVGDVTCNSIASGAALPGCADSRLPAKLLITVLRPRAAAMASTHALDENAWLLSRLDRYEGSFSVSWCSGECLCKE